MGKSPAVTTSAGRNTSESEGNAVLSTSDAGQITTYLGEENVKNGCANAVIHDGTTGDSDKSSTQADDWESDEDSGKICAIKSVGVKG
eukprot:2817402-Ditylum_brightwellii.AAC.1